MGFFGIVAASIGAVAFATFIVKVIASWFSDNIDGVSYIKSGMTEVAFVVAGTVLLMLLALTFSVVGMTIDFNEGMSVVQWLIASVTSVALLFALGGVIFSLILPLNFVLGAFICLFSHLFIASLAFVLMMVFTDVRLYFPIKRDLIPVVEYTDDTQSFEGNEGLSTDLVSAKPVVVEQVVEKTKHLVRRKGFKEVPIANIAQFLDRSIRYQLPNGVVNKGRLLAVKKDYIEVRQPKETGSITYTVLKKQISRIEAYQSWEETIYK
ncbi:MAG: hypothetical protein HOM11_17510 [Methylococcales bacterium]|jgi:hypothetical protein|nr:hypothetical protein [Methylococcales bacterium]MBT7443581.1 hypothetical protein [Methylococcales bacterium]